MKRGSWLAAATTCLAALTLVASAGAADVRSSATPGVSGSFSLVMMVHTSSGGFGDLPGVNPWNGARRSGGRFVYRSIPCSGNAPVNNIASDLPTYNARVKGSRVPSSVRAHPMAFTVRKRRGQWQIKGRLRFTVCKLGPGPTPQNDPVPDEAKPKFNVNFVAGFRRVNSETLRWTGTFKLRGGTGRYDDLAGSGRIAGYFLCFAPEGCAAKGGKYLDGQLVMHGRYSDPTPKLAG